jgi:hypothetical protein
MATTTQSPNDLTRQQLDELDDLLQRMLSLPLNPPESYTPPPQAYAPLTAPLPTPAPAPVPVAREVPAPIPTPAPAPVPAAAPAPRVFASAPAPEPVVPVEPAVRKPAPAPAPAFDWSAAAPAVTPAPVAFAAPAYVPPPPEPVSVLYAPFVAFNAVLNWTLGLFGFPGRVLRSGFVKWLFGLAGLGLLAYTGLKVGQVHGLVTLPQELPWPR